MLGEQPLCGRWGEQQTNYGAVQRYNAVHGRGELLLQWFNNSVDTPLDIIFCIAKWSNIRCLAIWIFCDFLPLYFTSWAQKTKSHHFPFICRSFQKFSHNQDTIPDKKEQPRDINFPKKSAKITTSSAWVH